MGEESLYDMEVNRSHVLAKMQVEIQEVVRVYS